jgi:hypothetical protein
MAHMTSQAETSRFTSQMHNQKLLFHGSKISNWVGLLSRGMLMPKSVTALGGKRTGTVQLSRVPKLPSRDRLTDYQLVC